LRFTVRRPASAEVSPCCHRPSGGDVACCVHVGIARAGTTGDTLKNRLALAVFRRDMAAVGASLRRVRRGDKFQAPHSFVLEPGHQQPPPVAADRTIESPFLCDVGARAVTGALRRAGHGPQVQVLDADGLEPTRHIGGGLFHPVTAPVGVTRPQPRDGELGSFPPVRSASRPGQTPLQSAQPLGLATVKAWGVPQLPGGQRRRHRHAAINADHAAIIGSRDGCRDDSKCDVPTPRAIPSDSVGFHRLGDVTGPAEPHPPNFGYPHLPVAPAEPVNVARFDADLSKSLMLTSLAPGGATVGAVEEVAHRLGEVAQRLLLHGLRSGCQPVVFGARSSQLGTLLVVARRLAAWLPMLLLLHCQIPHKPGVPTVRGQYSHLPRAGKQTEPTHSDNVTGATDNMPKGEKRRYSPG
jgi:hypothetical protein